MDQNIGHEMDRPATARQVEVGNGAFTVDAVLLGTLLSLPPHEVPSLLRERVITSRCERGLGEHEGEFRLSFFHGGRRAQLCIDTSGRILRQSVIDFGDRPLPPTLHRPCG